MSTVLCTLYNSLYLDKGLVLYDSLCKCTKNFKLYVLCMDEKCYEVLTNLKQEHHIPVRLADFETGDEELLAAKANRPIGEYCWTCSSSFIRYILKHYGEACCTYIDADMYFYNDPQVLIDEMQDNDKSVMVVPHRFPKEKLKTARTVGTYCVEFNTFLNTPTALQVLDYWRNRCLDCCSNIGDGVHWGDQKYLDELVEKFNCVHVCQNVGAGVAPWNLKLYKKASVEDSVLWKKTKKESPLIFFHYQYLKYITRSIINTNISIRRGVDFSLVNSLYFPYLLKIEQKKQLLEGNYGVDFLIKHHPLDKNNPKEKTGVFFSHLKTILSAFKALFQKSHPYIVDISKYDSYNNA